MTVYKERIDSLELLVLKTSSMPLHGEGVIVDDILYFDNSEIYHCLNSGGNR